MGLDFSTVKSAARNLLIAAVWTMVGCVVFVGAASIRMGILNFHRQGFWVPILTGGLTIVVILSVALPVTNRLRHAFRSKKIESDNSLFGRNGGRESPKTAKEQAGKGPHTTSG